MMKKLVKTRIYIFLVDFKIHIEKRMFMNTNVLTYIACVCFLFIFGRIFIGPIKIALKLVMNSILGGIVIFLINLIGGIWSFHIGLNFITSILIGLLGLPRGSCTYNSKIAIINKFI